MHLLIIGCGYLGGRVANAALRAGHTVSALTRSPERAAEWERQGLHPIIGDVLQPDSLKALPSADACLYAVGYDRTAAADKRTVYVDGLKNVLSVIDSRVPRLIFISSTSVYGQQRGELVDEQSICEPDTEGGRICLDAETAVHQWAGRQSPSRAATILRLSGIYGPRRLIARKEQLLQQTPLSGNPDAWLNLVHVDDAAQAVLKLLEGPFVRPLYLLSDEAPLRRREFYGAFAELLGTPPPVFQPHDEAGINKRCNSELIRRELPLVLKYPRAVDALPELLSDSAGS